MSFIKEKMVKLTKLTGEYYRQMVYNETEKAIIQTQNLGLLWITAYYFAKTEKLIH